MRDIVRRTHCNVLPWRQLVDQLAAHDLAYGASPRSASPSEIPGPSGIVAQLVTQAAAAASASSAATVWIGTYEPSASSSSGAASSCSNTRASGGVADGQSHVSNEQGACALIVGRCRRP